MTIVVERRTTLSGQSNEQVIDEANELLRVVDSAGGSTRIRLLRAIDPTMDTAFNQRQLPELADELHLLAQAHATRSVVGSLHDLVHNAMGEDHDYVVFVGH